uniref:hypothetical protein n=1 Tax=Sphingorhabdus sp. TaxID=1902408 RepID=UPI002FDE7314
LTMEEMKAMQQRGPTRPHLQPRALPAPMMPGAPQTPGGMGRPLPGGAAIMPAQAAPMTAPTEAPVWKNPVPAWQEFLLPTEFTDDRKAAALGKYNAEVAKYDAQQAAQAAAQARQARVSEGMSYGLTGKDLLAYAAAPDKFGENLAERQGVMSAGQSYQDGGQTAYTAPSPFESKTDAFGRPLSFDPTTGGYGEEVGEAKPMDVNGIVFDPVTMTKRANVQTPAQSGEMSDYERAKLEQDKANAEKSGASGVDFGDVKGVRETNEKRFQAFEESQRSFRSMKGLAAQDTGASDIALGTAFFKTFDPTSIVKESEFASAAGAMGLDARAQQAFAGLASGQKFTPELRQQLIDAATVHYNQLAEDMTGMVAREREFADRHGIPRQDIARNPITRIPPPPEAVNELLSNPTAEEIAEFNATFGYGQGEAIVARARRREYGGMNR